MAACARRRPWRRGGRGACRCCAGGDIERGNDAPAYSGGTNGQQPQGYWYRCNEPDGYYPYITHCPGGWLQVPAQPPAN